MKKISLLDVKTALRDGRFRNSLPQDMQPEVERFLKDPGCSCNTSFIKSVYQKCKPQLEAYFPGRMVEADKPDDGPKNHWTVINCHKDDLEARLRKLPNGPKQIAIARYEDQVTAIINEIGIDG